MIVFLCTGPLDPMSLPRVPGPVSWDPSHPGPDPGILLLADKGLKSKLEDLGVVYSSSEV